MSFFDLEVFPAPEKVELKNNDGDTSVIQRVSIKICHSLQIR